MKFIKRSYTRMVLLIILVVVEVIGIYLAFRYFYDKMGWIETIAHVFSMIIVLHLIVHSKHLSQDVIWIVLILMVPVVGTTSYLLVGADLTFTKTYKNILKETKRASQYLAQNGEIVKDFEDDAPNFRGQLRYISRSAGFPVYRNTGYEYFDCGEAGFPTMLAELRKAEKFIFLEYFIIEEGVMWNSILDILKKKVEEGVEVRVMYDDFGSITTLSASYGKQLEKMGIKCVTFNRVNPVINVIMNHRDHRKIMVIDGKVAFSGGINLADEYINEIVRFGYWKDNVFMVKGEAVWSYTVMFLTNWNALRYEDEDYLKYKAVEFDADLDWDGYVAPYGDTPLDDEIVGQNIYLNIINQANDYVYIITPYLIIDSDMSNALELASKRGVDVRIITPGIPDKKIVWQLTKSYYADLIEAGVKIYEYTPGFIHAKVFVSDDIVATTGSVNLDYRSLYLHFEIGNFLYDSSKIMDIKKDVVNILAVSHEVSYEETASGVIKKFFVSILRLVAPLL